MGSLPAVLLAVAAAVVSAQPVAADELEDAREAIAARLPGVDKADIRPAPVAGLYEVSVGSQFAYATADGRFLLSGDLIDLETRINLTEDRRDEARLHLLGALDESRMIVFSPAEAQVRHTLTVFTDIDCTYCRKLHSEMDRLNAHGIRVRYLLYPRTGPGTESWRKAVSVWCSKDRQSALTRAKRGEAVEMRSCPNAPVQEHYDLGQLLDIQGTPALVGDDGELLQGYLPADMLAAQLETAVQR